MALDLHTELLVKAVKAPKGSGPLGLTVQARLHRKQAAAERARRAQEGSGGPEHPWGRGSQPDENTNAR